MAWAEALPLQPAASAVDPASVTIIMSRRLSMSVSLG
jgi:hypothetical protein